LILRAFAIFLVLILLPVGAFLPRAEGAPDDELITLADGAVQVSERSYTYDTSLYTIGNPALGRGTTDYAGSSFVLLPGQDYHKIIPRNLPGMYPVGAEVYYLTVSGGGDITSNRTYAAFTLEDEDDSGTFVFVSSTGSTPNLTVPTAFSPTWQNGLNISVTVYNADLPAPVTELFVNFFYVQRHILRYDANGATSGTAPAVVYAAKDALDRYPVTIASNTGNLHKPGFTFSGWNKAANGRGGSVHTGSNMDLTSLDMTLYAQWTEMPSSGSIPAIEISGIDSLYRNPALFNSGDVALEANDGRVDFVPSLSASGAPVTNDLRTFAAEDVTPGSPPTPGPSLTAFFDLGITKKSTNKEGADAGSSEITDTTTSTLILTVKPPTGVAAKDVKAVYTAHNYGKPDKTLKKITTTNVGGEYFEVSGGNIVIHANKFSTFALAVSSAYIITSESTANGVISPSGKVPVNVGDSRTFLITPNRGYHVSDVVVNGTSVGARTSYEFKNVQRAYTITAYFEAGETPPPATPPGGTPTPTPPSTPTPTPDTGEPTPTPPVTTTPGTAPPPIVITPTPPPATSPAKPTPTPKPKPTPTSTPTPVPTPADPFEPPVPGIDEIPPEVTEPTPGPTPDDGTAPVVPAIAAPDDDDNLPPDGTGGDSPDRTPPAFVDSIIDNDLLNSTAPDAWSPLNLSLAALSLLAPAALTLVIFKKRGVVTKQQKIFTIVGLALGVASCVILPIVERFDSPAVLINRWTSIFATLFAISALFFGCRLVFTLRKSGD
jgi:uncharacterized repeat protein (TIGR02543 family)